MTTVEQALSTARGSWAYTARDGEGPALLLLHGGGLNLGAWDRVLELLPGVPAVAVDLPLHGRTTVSSWDWSSLVDDLTRLVQETRLVQPLVVGHSFGGWTGLALAAACPVLGVVSLDGWTGMPWPQRQLPPPPPPEHGAAPDANTLLQELTSQSDQLGLPADFVRAIGERSVTTSEDGLFRLRPVPADFLAELPTITGFDAAGAVRSLRVPLTFVLAKEAEVDSDAAERNKERDDLDRWLRRHASDAHVEWIPGDHNFPLSQPERTADLLRRALSNDRSLLSDVAP